MEDRVQRLAREKTLILAAKAGNAKARLELVESVTPFVHKAVNKYRRSIFRKQDIEDLRQSAFVYVNVAIDRFDVSRELYFLTYAFHWIRHGIQMALPNKNPQIEIEDDYDPDWMMAPEPEHKGLMAKDEERMISVILNLLKDRPTYSMVRHWEIVVDIVKQRWFRDEPWTLEILSKRHKTSRQTCHQIEISMKELIKPHIDQISPP